MTHVSRMKSHPSFRKGIQNSRVSPSHRRHPRHLRDYSYGTAVSSNGTGEAIIGRSSKTFFK